MKTAQTQLLKSGVATFVVGTALFLGQAAFAQQTPPPAATQASEPEPAEANSIIVTGSIVRNPAAATASPVTSLTSQDLTTKGITTVSDALQQITANNAGTAPTSWTSFGFATGASAPSLRGLNDAYTLTLFNGMRSAPYPLGDDGYRNFVDINTIPESIVDRIDVLQDGASATYGSDAIAGVVNVIIKKQITGLHANASAGISQRGDGGERRIDATYGFGKLDEQGFNVYVNGEYQVNDPLYLHDRGFPFNTADQSSICSGAGNCLTNNVRNGIQAGGGYNGFQSTQIPYVRPYSPALTSLGGYQLANPAAGCGGFNAITLTPAQRAVSGTTAGGQFVTPATVCQQDLVGQYRQYSPWIQRIGGNAKGTVKIGENAEAWLMFNFYNTRTRSNITPLGYTGQTADGGTVDVVGAIFLPAYVCPQGVGVLTPFAGTTAITATGCSAANGTLNPNNPFAASGNNARLLALPTQTRGSETNAKTYRVSGGIDGSFGDGWNYNLGAAASWVTLDIRQTGYIYLQGLMNAVAQGTFNFVNPDANTAAQNQLVFPDNNTHSVSKLTQIQGSINKDFMTLPGGALNVAVTAQYRYEAIHNPSANPANNANPEQRYYSINAVGVDGSRNVWSVGYEITAPIVTGLKVKALGAYDHYSTGQSRFSPKFEAEFQPIEQVKLRGTYSKGFRIPSFSESFALPTTGFTSAQIVCSSPTYAAFCAAHASNPSYYSGGYSPGQTSSGNPNLQPEKATSYTLGVVLQPTRRITLTADYWYTKITNVIVPVTISNDVFNQYYTQNGVVNIPGVTVTPGTPDPQNPGALPLLGSVVGSYKNADQFLAKGIDISARLNFPLNDNGLRWRSDFSASYLLRLQQTLEDGTVERFDGTLGPCAITSCSGAPKWRLSWTNTLDFNDKASVSLTANYTSGFSEVATDSGGTYGDCQQSTTDGQIVGFPDGTPVLCNAKSVFDLDGHAQVKIAGRFTLYGDMLNILNRRPPYDPNTAYGLYQFNPAWADKLFVGRYFRVGAKVDF